MINENDRAKVLNKKIVFIITGLTIGGAEKQVCLLADKLAELGNSVSLISLGCKGVIYPTNRNVLVYELGLRKNIVSFISVYNRLRVIIKEMNPDIIHSHMVHANLFARILRLSVSMKCLISSAHSDNDGGGGRIFAYRITDRLSDLTTNVSKRAVDSFIRKKISKPGRIVPIYNGIDVNAFHFNPQSRALKRIEIGLNDETKLILAIGRLTPAKDYKNLLTAFSMLDFNEKIQLAIIGDGVLAEELKEFSLKLGIDKKVHWLGIQHDISGWLSACDLFVLSSQWEGFGLVIAEAMACQRPVVATNVGGVLEVVGDSSMLVPPSNPKELKNKIVEVLNYDESYLNNIVTIGRDRVVNNFSIDKVIANWLYLYDMFKLHK